MLSNEISIETNYDKDIIGTRKVVKRLTDVKRGERKAMFDARRAIQTYRVWEHVLIQKIATCNQG